MKGLLQNTKKVLKKLLVIISNKHMKNETFLIESF